MGRSQAQLQLWEDVRTDSAYEEDLLGLSTEVAGGSQRQDPLSSCVTWGHPAPRLSCSQVSLSANYDNHASLRSGQPLPPRGRHENKWTPAFLAVAC